MSLEHSLQEDLKIALKSKDKNKLTTLRLLKSAIQYAKMQKSQEEFKDEDALKIIQKQIKQRKETIDIYETQKRFDLAEKEKAELAILITYLPHQLSENELQQIIEEAIADLNASGKQDMGKVIKYVVAKTQGCAEGRTISSMVGQFLTN